MIIAQLLGIVDILVGVLILFNFHTPLALIIFIIMIGKGVLSLMADIVGKVYGVLDMIGGVIVLLGLNFGLGVSVVLFLFFIYKGLVSLMPR